MFLTPIMGGGSSDALDAPITITLDAVGATSVDADLGLLIINTTAAAAGAQQYSPMLVLEGQGWKTNATAASQEVQFAFQVIPIEGAANPTGQLSIFSNINDGGFVERASLSSGGAFTATSLHATSATLTTTSVAANTSDLYVNLLIINTTAAAAGAQQYSPILVLEGQGWRTDATAASQEVQFGIQVVPVQGTANPTGRLSFFSNINDGGFTEIARFTSTTPAAADTTNLFLTDDNGIEQVTCGVADSGGTGYRLLRMPN